MFALNRENIQEAVSIDYLLVDDHKALLSIRAHFILQLDDFHHAIFDELPLGLHQLVSLACALVEEPRVHLSEKTHDHRFTKSQNHPAI